MEFIWLIYFFVGIIQDFLVTLNFRFIAKERIFLAAITSFVVTALGFLVIFDIISRVGEGSSIGAIMSYALGVGIGTIFALKLKLEKSE